MGLSGRVCVLSALLVLLGTAAWVHADAEADNDDAGVTVETEEEEQYHSPSVDPKKVYLAEHFDDQSAFKKRWIKSEAKKQGVDENLAKYDGIWELQEPMKKILKNDLGLVLTTEAKHAAIATLLDRPFTFTDKPLVVQYEVTMQEGQNCGGAYLKLLSRGMNTVADLRKFYDQTPYTVMFGPDKCGNDHKLHFIFRHVNPVNQTIEEKHCKKPRERLDDIYKDKEPHLYTLIIKPDNTFSILVDRKEVNSGSLLEDFTPPVNPPEEIDDPNDKKPEDWDEREKIVDPTAQKPEDWDEEAPAQIPDPNAVKPDNWLDDAPAMIPDPEAVKPEDWDDEMDGEWEAPLIDNPACAAAAGCGPWAPPNIPNPAYKGPWRAPLIANPNYRGKWTPRRIRNPHYFKDDHPFRMTPIHAVGFELWSMSPRLLFDNLIITDDPSVANAWAEQSFALKRARIERDSDSVMERALKFAGENPWVWGVLVLIVIAVIGSIVYCCQSSEPEIDAKKTDAFQEDDQEQASEGETEPPMGAGEPVDAGAEPEEPQGGDKEPAAEEPSEATPSATDAEGGGDHPRRRKPRRE